MVEGLSGTDVCRPKRMYQQGIGYLLREKRGAYVSHQKDSYNRKAFTHTKEATMRSAKPMKLYCGRWGAWVPGKDIEPDMLVRICTRYGKSWYSRVKRVRWQGTSGAICERIDISVEDDLNLEIPFLSNVKPDSLLYGWIRNWVYSRVEDAEGPAPVIDQYEYYEEFESDRDFYEYCAQEVIEELRQALLSLHLQSTQSGPSKSSLGGASTFREDKVAGDSQVSVTAPMPTVEDRSETHCLKCGRESSRCICKTDNLSKKIVIDKYGSVYFKRNHDWHH